MIIIDDIDFEPVLKEVREKLDPLYVKHECLHEMLNEFYDKKDFDSDTVIYLLRKIDELNGRMETLRKVRDYLANMADDVPFQVNRRVGRYMVQFGLTQEQAQLLLDTYKEHRKAMSPVEKEKCVLVAAEQVEWLEEDKCLLVQFEDTYWHYGQDGSWCQQ